jgi:iron complex outermembrane receptor protein
LTKSVVVRSLLLTGAFTAMSIASAAYAQDTAPAASAPASDNGDIVVTAQRRSESLSKVPLSVAVLNGDQLRNVTSAGGDILDLSGRIPGLYAETTTGRIFPRFYIRGLGNIDFYLGASQPVSIIQDDVVLEHVVLKSNPLFDVNQVEVLRGPQGSLFGRNTTAGIIKFDTIRPTQDFQGRVNASLGTYDTVNIDAGVGGPIVKDVLAFRVSALYQHRDNWVTNTYVGPSADGTVSPRENAMGGYNERDVRAQLLFTPGDNLSVLLSGHARDYFGTATLFHRGGLVKGSNDITAATNRNTVAYDEAANNPQAYKTYGTSGKVAYDFGGVTLTSITALETTHGYSRGDTDGGAATQFGNTGFGESMGQVRHLDQFTEEARLASADTGAFKWQVGGIYFDSRDVTDFYQRGYFLTPGVTGANPNNWVRLHDVNTSWAAFGQVSYAITPALTITAGGRITNDTKTTTLLKTANTAANVVTYTGRNNVRLSDTKPSWDVSALYQLSSEVSLYARVARGFRGPTIQGRSAVFNADFTTAGSETITSYEAGIKTNLLDHTLRFNLTGFAYTVKNIQLNGNDSFGNGVLFNADKAKAYGMEAELDWHPTSRLAITAGLSLLHTEIDDKRVFAQVCALNGVVVCTVLNPTVTVGTNVFAQIDGNPLPNAPKYNVDIAARYDLPVSDHGKLFFGGDWNMQGYTSLVPYKTVEFTSNGNFELGLKLGYATNDGRYEVAVFGRNVTGERNLKGVIDNYMAAVFNEPAIYGVSLSSKF